MTSDSNPAVAESNPAIADNSPAVTADPTQAVSTTAQPPPRARTVFAPHPTLLTASTASVFLAGSIDMGLAPPWQSSLTAALADLPITLINPRRPDWDSTWTQDLDCAPFVEQVTWELDALDACSVIALFLSADSMAPISLLELGLWIRSGRVVVGCEKGYWRRGNVLVVCQRWGVEVVDSLEELGDAVKGRLRGLGVEGA